LGARGRDPKGEGENEGGQEKGGKGKTEVRQIRPVETENVDIHEFATGASYAGQTGNHSGTKVG